jgi:hypothetical protein
MKSLTEILFWKFVRCIGCFAALFAVLESELDGQTRISLQQQSRQPNLSSLGATMPVQIGTILPTVCTEGELFYKSNEPAGTNLFSCGVSNTWTRLSSSNLPSQSGQVNGILATDGSTASWLGLGGDVSGPVSAISVNKLKGRNVGDEIPLAGNVLRWDVTASRWRPGNAGLTNYAKYFQSQTTIAISGIEHGFGTDAIVVACYDDQSPAGKLDYSGLTVNASTYDVAITFAQASSGRCVLNGSGGSAVFGVLSAGRGLLLAQSSAASRIELDTSLVPTYLMAEQILTFDPIAAGECAVQTMSFGGAVLGAGVAPGWPDLEATVLGMMTVVNAGQLQVKLCNLAASPTATITKTFRATIVRSF